MKTSFALIAAAAASFVSLASAASARASGPEWVRLRSVTYAGSGCPAGSYPLALTQDELKFTFDTFVAQVGPGVPFSEKRKNCTINISLDYPQGWSFSLYTVDYLGHVSLDSGARATQKTSYFFQGQAQTATLSSNFFGPVDRNYQIRDTLAMTSLVWSPCGAARALNLNAAVQVDAPSGRSGLISLDSLEVPGSVRYGILWQHCR